VEPVVAIVSTPAGRCQVVTVDLEVVHECELDVAREGT